MVFRGADGAWINMGTGEGISVCEHVGDGGIDRLRRVAGASLATMVAETGGSGSCSGSSTPRPTAVLASFVAMGAASRLPSGMGVGALAPSNERSAV